MYTKIKGDIYEPGVAPASQKQGLLWNQDMCHCIILVYDMNVYNFSHLY